jgi:septal ring factor EnvC (AmiA/AmiB activator)
LLLHHAFLTNRGTAAALATCSIGVLLTWVHLGAQDADRLRTEAMTRRSAARLQTLYQEATRLGVQERTLLGDLQRLEIDRQIKTAEFVLADSASIRATAALAEVDAQLRQVEQRVIAEGPDRRARLVHLYKLGQGRYLRLLLSTADVRNVRQAARVVAAMAARDQNRIAAHQRLGAELTAARAVAAARQQQAAALRVSAEQARAGPDRAITARNTLIREIGERRDLNQRLSGELLAAQQKLQATLTMFSSGAPSGSTLPIGPFRGDLEWPVAGALRRPFNRPDRAGGPVSSGIDIAAGEGNPVIAVHPGTVAFAGSFAGFGNLAIVDHGAQAFSLYGNLAELAVSVGDRLVQGDAIGPVGVSPTGAVGLYFELRVDGRPVDPVQWLRKR